MRPGQRARDWMEATPQRFAYRCLPLTIANTFGWELLAPMRVVAEWAGGESKENLAVYEGGGFATSHFGSGILTFHPGFLFRTEPNTQLLARGAPNHPKDGVYALEGVVETDWLSFTFTMNYLFTRPGRVAFEKGEPFCFVTPVRVADVMDVQPTVLPIEADADEARRFGEWSRSRLEWNARLTTDPAVAEQGWQKFYHRGTHADGSNETSAEHISKLRLKPPIEVPA